MWKRNVAIGITALLLCLSAALTFTNVKQQDRIDALEQIRVSTSETVETEVQRYLSNSGAGLMLNVLEETNTSAEDLVNNALNELINTENGESVAQITMQFTEAQKQELAQKMADITYDNLTAEVIAGRKEIDVTKLENEVATAVTEVMMDYVDSAETRYVTIEGDTDAIVSQIVSQLNSEIVSNTGSNSSGVTESDVKNAVSKEEIESLVKSIISSSSVTKETKETFEKQVIQETIDSLKKYNIVKAGKDGIDGKDAVFSEKEATALKEEIITNLSKNQELAIYGEPGDGIIGTRTEGQEVFLLIGDRNTQESQAVAMSLGNIVGNTLLGMETVNIGPNTDPAVDTTYQLKYYTQFKVDNNSMEIPNGYCITHEMIVENGQDHCDEYNAGGTGKEAEDCKLSSYWSNVAGTIELDQTTIDKVVSDMEKNIVSALETQLGSDDYANVYKGLQNLQNTIDTLQQSITGENASGISQKDGLNVLLNQSTDDTNASAGSLKKYVQDVQTIGGRFDTFNSIAGAESSGDNSYTTVYEQLTKPAEFITIEIKDSHGSEGNGYWTISTDYTGINANPTLSLIGAANDAGTIPSTKQSKIWALCKYIKVEKSTDADNPNGTITFYFVYDDNHNQSILNSFRGEKLYFALTNTGLPSAENSSVILNQVATDYGVTRVKEYISGTESDKLILEGYDNNPDKLVITDFVLPQP